MKEDKSDVEILYELNKEALEDIEDKIKEMDKHKKFLLSRKEKLKTLVDRQKKRIGVCKLEVKVPINLNKKVFGATSSTKRK